MAWRFAGALAGLLGIGLAGCSSTIGLYHSAEGGAIAADRQPPPGADQPYPNLAGVPPAPVGLTPVQQAVVSERLAGSGPGAVQSPAPGALAGLELPDAPPAPPGVGLEPAPPPVVYVPPAPGAPAVAAAPRPDSAPVALAFAPGSAVLDPAAATALTGLAAARGNGEMLVAGFGEGGDDAALRLGLARAQRLADGLTAQGVPPVEITLLAAAAGSGGFVQIVY